MTLARHIDISPNAHAERVVKKVVEGARTLLERAGLPSWSVVMGMI